MPLGNSTAGVIANRLRLSHPLTAALNAAFKILPDLESLPETTPSRIVAQLDEIPMITIAALTILKPSDSVVKMLNQYSHAWRKVQPSTDGYTLLAQGLRPGPAYRQILWSLRAAWLDGKINTEEQELILLRQMMNPGQY